MRDGEMVQIDTPDKLLRRPKNKFVQNLSGKRD